MRVTDNSDGVPVATGAESPFMRPGWIQRLGQSVSAKLMASIFIVLFITFALLGYFIIQSQRKHLEAAALVSAEQQSEVLRRSASRYMLNNDRIGLYEMMVNMADQPGMVRVRIMNPKAKSAIRPCPARSAPRSISRPRHAMPATKLRSR